MISVKKSIKSPFTIYAVEKQSNRYQVILTYLETNDIQKRKIAYALAIPKFDRLPSGLKEIIRQKWLAEQKKELLEKEFRLLCDKVFNFQVD